ncbi:MAG: 2-aminophenol/2-amino-5-chlorophenol 1,6-dioxygenase alpha subunit [Gammaproteobacteria bacterium]|jgi:2-aminophenol/2-amino-5-chlorophenol 1,6-dioxygenase alpha subunit
MSVVSAFLIPGSPLPYVQRDNPPWGAMAEAMEKAGQALAASKPDVIAIYSTQWIAVLDQLWQVRPNPTGLHVDENWHEYGELPFDMRTDTELAEAAIGATDSYGIRSKGVDYDAFPVDTGTIVASNFLDPEQTFKSVVTANNLYHDWAITENLGRVIREQAEQLGRKVAIVGVGGLSGSFFRQVIDIASDHVANPTEDEWNKRILAMMEQGDVAALREACPEYAQQARVEMGFKHFAFILGGVGGKFNGATVHHYGPLYGTGGAVVEFRLS